MWLIPTRNRPQAMMELIGSMRGEFPDAAVMIDGDASLYSGVNWPSNWHIHTADEHLEMQRAINALYRLHPNEKTYGFLTDHARPETPGWFRKMEDQAGDWLMVLCADGKDRRHPENGYRRITAASCYGGELVREMGYLWPDFCTHMYGDDALEEIGHELGIVRWMPDVMVRDLHLTDGEVKPDENHKRLYKGVPYIPQDAQAFTDWKANTKPELMARLASKITTRRKITVCCVQAQNYCQRGAEYVNKLHDMVIRNMPDGVAFRFVCFTDDSSGLSPSIESRELPEKLQGWWNKLGMFKAEVFERGESVMFLDLDTLVTSYLDDMVSTVVEFAALRDFYRPRGLGSGVMLWTVSERTEAIWSRWAEWKVMYEGGDQEAIERFYPDAKRLQDLFPGKFVSYKVDCNPYPPSSAAVVCFHGDPKPHNCTQGWVQSVWKIGGDSSFGIRVVPNMDATAILENVRKNEQAAPWIGKSPEHNQIAVIVGSGPSLLDDLDKIAQVGGVVFALNNAAKILHDHGILADYQVILDARPQNVEFVKEQYASRYLIASQCAPELFEALQGREVYQWHPAIDGIADLFPNRPMTLIGGGITVGLSSMALVYAMGFRKMALFGYDSSYRSGEGHAAPQSRTAKEAWTFEVNVAGRTFVTNAAMAKQAEQFPLFVSSLIEDCEIAVFGDGLLPFIARNLIT